MAGSSIATARLLDAGATRSQISFAAAKSPAFALSTTGQSGLHIDDDRALDVDQIIEPITELNALVGFGGLGRARVYRRDRLWQLAIRVGIFVVKSAEKLGNRTRLAP
jgi:hypothetical protein